MKISKPEISIKHIDSNHNSDLRRLFELLLQVQYNEKLEHIRFKCTIRIVRPRRRSDKRSRVDASGGNEENSVRLSPDLVDEGIKVSLEPLHAQISALTEMIDSLIPGNSAWEITTASTGEPRHQPEGPFTGTTGTSRFSTVAPLTIAWCSLNRNQLIWTKSCFQKIEQFAQRKKANVYVRMSKVQKTMRCW